MEGHITRREAIKSAAVLTAALAALAALLFVFGLAPRLLTG